MKKFLAFLFIAAIATGCSITQQAATQWPVVNKHVWRVGDTIHFEGMIIVPLPTGADTILAKYDSLFHVIDWIIRKK